MKDDRDLVVRDAITLGDRFDFLRRAAPLAGLELAPVPRGDTSLGRSFFLGKAVGRAELF